MLRKFYSIYTFHNVRFVHFSVIAIKYNSCSIIRSSRPWIYTRLYLFIVTFNFLTGMICIFDVCGVLVLIKFSSFLTFKLTSCFIFSLSSSTLKYCARFIFLICQFWISIKELVLFDFSTCIKVVSFLNISGHV